MMESPSIWLTDFRPWGGSTPQARFLSYQLYEHQGFRIEWPDHGDAAALCIPLPYQGWHEIHLGFLGASGCRVQLSGDAMCRWAESTVRWDRSAEQGEEGFWKMADLTGRTLLIKPLPPGERRHDARRSGLAYIRLVPLTDAQAKQRLQEMRDNPYRTAGAVIDGHEVLGAAALQNADEVRATLEPFIDSDFKRIYWSANVTSFRMNYLSQATHYLGKDQCVEDMHSDNNRYCAQSLQIAARHGYDPLEVLIDYAAQNNMELWPVYRIQQDYPLDYAGGFGLDVNSSFAEAHQHWNHIDEHGSRVSRTNFFSMFHLGWQDYKLKILAELAQKTLTGLRLDLMSFPEALWDYAPHAIEEFRRCGGGEPLIDGTIQPQWYQYRCEVMTAFMRKLRQQTDAIAAARGRKIKIAVQVNAATAIQYLGYNARTLPMNYLHGYDVAAWLQEGLVDVVCPSFRRDHAAMFLDHRLEEWQPFRDRFELSPSLGQYHPEVFPQGYDWEIYFTNTGQGRRDLLPLGELDAWRILREANDLYHQQADAVDIWEMGSCANRPARWHILKQVGHRDMLEKMFGNYTAGLNGKALNPFYVQVPSGEAEV